jgi:hypothetical protein
LRKPPLYNFDQAAGDLRCGAICKIARLSFAKSPVLERLRDDVAAAAALEHAQPRSKLAWLQFC